MGFFQKYDQNWSILFFNITELVISIYYINQWKKQHPLLSYKEEKDKKKKLWTKWKISISTFSLLLSTAWNKQKKTYLVEIHMLAKNVRLFWTNFLKSCQPNSTKKTKIWKWRQKSSQINRFGNANFVHILTSFPSTRKRYLLKTILYTWLKVNWKMKAAITTPQWSSASILQEAWTLQPKLKGKLISNLDSVKNK